MTVERMRAEMGQGEYVAWSAFHARRAQQEDLARKKARR